MVRALALVVFAGCSFAAHSPAGADGSTTGGEGGIAPSDAAIDAPIEQLHTIDVVGTVTDGPHTDFPVLVAVTKDWLRATTSGGTVASPTGTDIAFYNDAAATELLAFELERYSPTTGELVAWVKLPQLATATRFYIAAGNSTITTSRANGPAVWTNSFAGVWHLSNLVESTATDATTEAGATPTTDTAGAIADARAFTSAMLSAGTAQQVTDVFATGGTAEAWVNATNGGGSGLGRIFDKGPSYFVLSMCNGNSDPNSLLFGRTIGGAGTNWCTTQDVLTTGTWAHVAVTFDDRAGGPQFYVNGAPVAIGIDASRGGTANSDSGGPLTIGDRTTGGRAFAGSLDELRLVRTTRSDGWIATEYANQSDPAWLSVN